MISSHSLHQAGDAFTQVQTAFVLFQFGKASNGMEWTRRGFERRRSGHSIPVFFGYETLARSEAEEPFGIFDLYQAEVHGPVGGSQCTVSREYVIY